MSDSDDDAAFASADEGEDNSGKAEAATKSVKDPKKPEVKEQKTEKAKVEQESKKQTASVDKSKKQKGKNKKGKQSAAKKVADSVDKPSSSSQGQSSRNVDDKSGGDNNSVEKSNSAVEVKAAVTGTPESRKDSEKEKSSSEKQREDDISGSSNIKDKKQEEESPTTDSRSEGRTSYESLEKDVNVPQGKEEDKSLESQKSESQVTAEEAHSAKSALDKLTQSDDGGGGWGSWGSWGSKLVNVASTSVSTFGNQIGEGFTTIMDTVETTLGVPAPEEMAVSDIKEAPPLEDIPRCQGTGSEDAESQELESSNKTPEDKLKDKEITDKDSQNKEVKPEAEGGGGWFSSWGVSSLSSVVQNTTSMSKHLVSGSLDVLETIGKKTFDVIKEHDPMLRKTKELFLFEKGDKPNLSHVLREAKKDSEARVELEHQMEEARKVNFGAVFDEFQGLAHLEALEILSNQCEKKIQSLLTSMSEESLAKIKAGLIDIKKVFEREEDEEDEVDQDQDFEKLVTEQVSQLQLGTTPDKLNKAQKGIREKIEKFDVEDKSENSVQALHQLAIQSLAELTSKAVEHFHKAGELVLLQRDSDTSFLDKAKNLESLTKVLCNEVEIISTRFSQCLNKLPENIEDSTEVNPVLTNIYLEASNSSTYIQDAFQLLLPCLQQAAIESTASQS